MHGVNYYTHYTSANTTKMLSYVTASVQAAVSDMSLLAFVCLQAQQCTGSPGLAVQTLAVGSLLKLCNSCRGLCLELMATMSLLFSPHSSAVLTASATQAYSVRLTGSLTSKTILSSRSMMHWQTAMMHMWGPPQQPLAIPVSRLWTAQEITTPQA